MCTSLARLVPLVAVSLLAACGSTTSSPPAAAPCTTAPVLGALAWTNLHPDGTSGPTTIAGDRVVLHPASVTAACGTSGLVWHWDLLQKPSGSGAVLASATGNEAVLVADVPGGQYQVMAAVTDSAGNTSPPVFATVVTSPCGSIRPVLAITAPTTANAYAPVALGSTVTDAGAGCADWLATGGPYTYAWRILAGPPGGDAVLSSPTASATVFVARVPGAYVVEGTITSMASGLSSPPATATITVSACGASPPTTPMVLSPNSRPTVGSQVTLLASSIDPDTACAGQTLSIEWSLVSAPLGSAATATQTAPAGNVAGAQLTFVADLAGTYAFSVVAVDSTGLRSAARIVDVPTGPCGPLVQGVSATPSFAIVGDVVTFAVVGTILDVCIVGGGIPATRWSLVSAPAGSAATIGPATGMLVPDLVGVYTARLTVTDAGGFSTTLDQSVGVGGCTAAPLVTGLSRTVTPLDGGALSIVPSTGDLVQLSASAVSAACGAAMPSPLRFAWTMLARPAGSGAVLAGAGSAIPSFVPDVPGTYQLVVVATDGFGNASAPSFLAVPTTSCGANAPVIVSLTMATAATTFTPVTASATAVDADADGAQCPARFDPGPLTIHWALVASPAGALATPTDATGPATTLVADRVGSWALEAWATTASGRAGPRRRVDLSVAECGGAPVIGEVAARQLVPVVTSTGPLPVLLQSLSSDTVHPALYPGFPVSLDGTVTSLSAGCGPGALAYAWRLSRPAGSAAVLDDPNWAGPSFTPDVAGTYGVDVTVNDAYGHAATVSYPSLVRVGTCGLAAPRPAIGVLMPTPVTAPVASTNVLLGQFVQLDASASTFPDAVPFDLGGCGLAPTPAYAWRFVAAPYQSVAQFRDTGAPTSALLDPTFQADVTGLFTVELSVSDGRRAATATVQVNSN